MGSAASYGLALKGTLSSTTWPSLVPPVGQIQAEDRGHRSQASEKDADVGLKLVYSRSRFRRSKESSGHDETPTASLPLVCVPVVCVHLELGACPCFHLHLPIGV